LAVAEKEGGKAGQWVSNRNGTHDVGSMQFNTAYLGDLARYGITSMMSHNPVAIPMIWQLGDYVGISSKIKAICGQKRPIIIRVLQKLMQSIGLT
jgi:hypothetical protein